MSWSDVIAYVNENLPSGVFNNISAQKVRESIIAVINQINQGSTDPQNQALWDEEVTYPADTQPVFWRDEWFVSEVANNLGVEPMDAGGNVNTDWRKVSASVGSGISQWGAKVYPNALEIVFDSGKLYYLDRAVVGTEPFSSLDLATEIGDDKWKNFLGSIEILDEDDLSSDSPTKPPSQQSIKAYVDARTLGKSATGLIKLNNPVNYYGEGSPLTGPINFDLSDSIISGGAVIEHNDDEEPPINTNLNVIKIGGYVLNVLNVIIITRLGPSTLGINYIQPEYIVGSADLTAPAIFSAIIENGNPGRLKVKYTEVVTAQNALGLGITGDQTMTVDSIISGVGTDTITYAISPDALGGTDLTLNVTADNTVTDLSVNANPLAPVNFVITNNTGVAVPLSSPANFAATDIESDSMTLSWDAVTNAENYILQRGLLPDYSDAAQIYSGPSTSFGDSGLSELTDYYYRVKAQDTDLIYSDSSYSAISETTLEDTYVVWDNLLRADDLGAGTIKLNATGSSTVYGNGGYATLAINGDNAILFKGDSQLSRGAQGLGLTNAYAGIIADGFDMDIWVQLRDTGSIRVFEGGVVVQDSQTYVASDEISIRYSSGTPGTVTVEKNGTTIYTSGLTFTLPLTPIGLLANTSLESKLRNCKFETSSNLIASPL